MALIYRRLLILTTCICACTSVVRAFKSGFSKDSCDSMVPMVEQSPTGGGTTVSNSGSSSANPATEAPVETTTPNSVTQTETPTFAPTEEPQDKPEDQTEAPTDKGEDQTEAPEDKGEDQTEAPEDKGEDPTEAPTNKPEDLTEAPEDKGEDQTEAPEDKNEDPTEAPEDKSEDQTEAPEDKNEDPTEAPTDKGEDPTEAPTDKSEDQTEAPEDNGETKAEAPEENAQTNEPAEEVTAATEEQPSNKDEGESTSDAQTEEGDAPVEGGEEATTASEAGDGEEPSPETAELYKAALMSSEEASPFKIKLSSNIYRRNRPIQITLTGERFHAVMLQVRKDSARFGSFTEVSETLQTVECDAQKPTAVTNKDMNNKVNVTVTWTAPEDDEGPLTATATFVREDKYWGMVKSDEMLFSEFPTNLADCAKSKSCVRLGSANCNEDSCRYVVTYQLTNDNSSVEFVIGGDVKVNGYIGLAFVENSQPRTTMDTTACLRTSENTAEIKHYTFGPEGTLKTSNVEPVDLKWELVDKERLWCKFSLPVKESKEGMKFTRPLYQVYLQGEFQVGNKSEEMIAPMNGGYVLSKNAVSISDLVDQRLPNGSTIPASAVYLIITMLLFYSLT